MGWDKDSSEDQPRNPYPRSSHPPTPAHLTRSPAIHPPQSQRGWVGLGAEVQRRDCSPGQLLGTPAFPTFFPVTPRGRYSPHLQRRKLRLREEKPLAYGHPGKGRLRTEGPQTQPPAREPSAVCGLPPPTEKGPPRPGEPYQFCCMSACGRASPRTLRTPGPRPPGPGPPRWLRRARRPPGHRSPGSRGSRGEGRASPGPAGSTSWPGVALQPPSSQELAGPEVLVEEAGAPRPLREEERGVRPGNGQAPALSGWCVRIPPRTQGAVGAHSFQFI